MRSVRLSHTTRVPLPLEAAMRCFTPVGERDWMDGWAPEFPLGGPDGDGDEADTVFLAAGATWVVVERSEACVRYARVTPGVMAGTVSVRCRPDGEATGAEVTYALTALSAEGERRLEDLAAGYPEHIDGWSRAIADRLLP